MEGDDEMIVVIVGDNTQCDVKASPEIKLEQLEVPVEDLIQKAVEHGHRVDLKIKCEDEMEDIEFLEDENYFPHPDEEEDEDFAILDNTPQGYTRKKKKLLYKNIKCKSYVSLLKKGRPELNDEKKLVDALVQLMKQEKPPKPPADFCLIDDNFFVCVLCGTSFDSLPATERHYHEKHGPRYLKCYSCGVNFRSKTNLYKHEKRCIMPDASTVLKARALYIGTKARNRPFIKKEDPPPDGKRRRRRPRPPTEAEQKYKCQECPAEYVSKRGLVVHGQYHRGERPYQCQYCPMAYTTQSRLTRHCMTHTEPKFICDHCGRAFKVKSVLAAHLDTHLPQKKHACTECDKRFAQKFALILHVNSKHRNLPPPCACQICPKRYPRMSILKDHMKKVHGMALMTRAMFFKMLPSMTESQIESAKVILKSDVDDPRNNIASLPDNTAAGTECEPVAEQVFIKIENEDSQDGQQVFYSDHVVKTESNEDVYKVNVLLNQDLIKNIINRDIKITQKY